jgi:hypothetical protein
VMSGRTGLHAHQTRRKRGEELDDLRSPKLPSNDLACHIDAVDLKYILR